MGSDAVQAGKGISPASKTTTQSTSSIPPMPQEKLNELISTLETCQFCWRVSLVKGKLQEIMIIDINDQEPRVLWGSSTGDLQIYVFFAAFRQF
jgi:hypothetical protein